MKRAKLYAACGAILLFASAGCGGTTKVLRSNNPELIYTKALEYYEGEKWSKASLLFESIGNIYNGTPREDSIMFFNAYCKYKSYDLNMAVELFDQFRRRFGRSVFIERAEAILANCYFSMSPPPTRDQTVTTQARIAIREYMSRYPQSEHTESFKAMDSILLQRLYDKSYNNAYTYYKIGRYKSAIVALRNALKEYPETNHREEILYLVALSSYRLAANSVSEKQTDRYLSALDSYYSFIEEYPESPYRNELDRTAQHIKDYLDKNRDNDEENTEEIQ